MLVLDQLRQWQTQDTTKGGPEEWTAAWDRAVDLLAPLWPDQLTTGEGALLVDGGAALACALYTVAREEGISPAAVTRDQVATLLTPAPEVALAGWERRLEALGHTLADPADPVAARWRLLAVDHSPPDDLPEHVWEAIAMEDHATRRWGPGALEGLARILAPTHAAQLAL